MKIGNLVRFVHEKKGGPVHRIVSVMADGMVELNDMGGYFAPHLFVMADDIANIPPTTTKPPALVLWRSPFFVDGFEERWIAGLKRPDGTNGFEERWIADLKRPDGTTRRLCADLSSDDAELLVSAGQARFLNGGPGERT